MAKKSERGPLRVDWPVGPEFTELDARGPVHAWVKHKLDSADWYLNRLKQVSSAVPTFQHQIGVEMALEGALESLCSAVDAACAGIIQAAEIHLPAGKNRTPEHCYAPGLAVNRLREQRRSKTSKTSKALEAAIEIGPKKESPSGWFAQLGRLRNTMVHRSALNRTRYFGGLRHGDVEVEVPGLGLRDLLLYLDGTRVKVGILVEQLLNEVSELDPGQTVGRPSQGAVVTPETACVT